MKEVFYDVIKEACQGEVIIDNEPWPCGFNTKIIRDGKEIEYFNDVNKSMLYIKNEQCFFELLEEYVNLEIQADRRYYKIYDDVLRNKVKAIMTYLFVNATTEEFLNPERLIRRKIEFLLPEVEVKRNIAFLNDDTFDYLEDGKEIYLDNSILNGSLKMKKVVHGLVMETPYKVCVSLVNRDSCEELECPLADVTYGICEEDGKKVCYVYSIMKPKEKKNISDEEKKYQKKVNRALYKLNDGVMEQESDEFVRYKNGESSYYPENISDVTHGFVLALTAFISLLQREGISKVKAVPYLPVRYLGREVSAYRVEDENRRNELLERNDMIQSNASEKFIRFFRRVAYHMGDAMELFGIPYENDEYLTYRIYEKSDALNNEILDQVSEGILNLEREKSL